MAKKVTGTIKLQLPAGAANPAPPVGPALGAAGVNIMAFCKDFNARTKDKAGTILPTVITVYADRSFSFITKSPPAAVLLKKAAGVAKGSGVPNKDKGGQSHASRSLRSSKRSGRTSTRPVTRPHALIIEGTARSMGLEVID
jgi:large subunit ribosomal protein L11